VLLKSKQQAPEIRWHSALTTVRLIFFFFFATRQSFDWVPLPMDWSSTNYPTCYMDWSCYWGWIDPDDPLDIRRFCNSVRVISYNKLARQACSVQQVVAPATRFTRSTSSIIFVFRAFDQCLHTMEFSERAIVARIFDGNFVFLFFKNRYFRLCPVFFISRPCVYLYMPWILRSAVANLLWQIMLNFLDHIIGYNLQRMITH
jgi:hypothetical protein